MKLAKTGTLALTGDCITTRKRSAATRWRRRRATRRSAPKSTRKAVDEFVKKTGGQMWIGHDLVGFSKLRKVPGVLRMRPRVSQIRRRRHLIAAVATSPRGRVTRADAKKAGDWAFYSADNRATKYSAADQINKDNVSKLRVAWRRPQADPALLAANPGLRLSNRYTATPIMVNGVLYVPDGFGLVEAHRSGDGTDAVDAEAADAGADGLQGGGAHWGVAYWSQGAEARIFTTRAQYLFALDAKTGEPFADFGDGGKVDLNVGLGPLMKSFRWSGVPLIARDVVVIGSSMLEQDSARTKEGPPGDVRAYDIRTGKLRWTFHVIPHAGEPGAETWENESNAYTGAGNVWSMMSADDELGYVYLPTSGGDQRHVRRAPAGQQSLHELDRLPRREDRQARLALPDGAPRSVRLRQPGRADPRRHHRGRPADQGGRAGHQAGVCVRARPRDGQAGVADRRAARAARPTCPARRRRRRSRFRPSRRRSSGRGCRRTI